MKPNLKTHSIIVLSSVFLLAACTGNPPPQTTSSKAVSSSSEATTSPAVSSSQQQSSITTVTPTSEASSASSEEKTTSNEEVLSSEETVSSEEVISSQEAVSSDQPVDSSMAEDSSEEAISSSSMEASSEEELSIPVIENQYTVSVNAPAGYRFDFENDQYDYPAGATVTFTAVNTDASRKIKKVYWYVASAPDTLNVIVGNEGVYSFIMPNENVTIKGEVDRYYSLALNQTHCTITITSPIKQYYRNDTVTFTVAVDDGFELDRVYLSWLETEEEVKGEKTLDLKATDGVYSFSTRTGAMTLYAIASEKSQVVSEDPFTLSEYQGDYTSKGYYAEHMYLQFKFDGKGKLYWCIYFDKNSGWDDWGEWVLNFVLLSGVNLDDTTNYEPKISSRDYIAYTYDTTTGNVNFGSYTLKTTLVSGVVTQVKCMNDLGSDGLYATNGTVCTKI